MILELAQLPFHKIKASPAPEFSIGSLWKKCKVWYDLTGKFAIFKWIWIPFEAKPISDESYELCSMLEYELKTSMCGIDCDCRSRLGRYLNNNTSWVCRAPQTILGDWLGLVRSLGELVCCIEVWPNTLASGCLFSAKYHNASLSASLSLPTKFCMSWYWVGFLTLVHPSSSHMLWMRLENAQIALLGECLESHILRHNRYGCLAILHLRLCLFISRTIAKRTLSGFNLWSDCYF